MTQTRGARYCPPVDRDMAINGGIVGTGARSLRQRTARVHELRWGSAQPAAASGSSHALHRQPHACEVRRVGDFSTSRSLADVQRSHAFPPNIRSRMTGFRLEHSPPRQRRDPRTFVMNTYIGNHTSRTNFDEVVLPHLDAAHRLARWLTRNEHDAEDAVQEASLRAFRSLRTFSGVNARAWFLRIVRNTCYGSFSRRPLQHTDVFDEEHHSSGEPVMTPETLMLQADDAMLIEHAMRDLPDRFRELLVLREIEGLSYKELARVFGIPMGTVMSGLSRARQAFQRALSVRLQHTNRQSSAPSRSCACPGRLDRLNCY